jgi:hypothetical protein
MKLSISKTSMTVMEKNGSNGEYDRGSAGEAYRCASVSDTYGRGKPTRTNPMGFMAMQCFSGSPDQKQSPTSKPGNAGGKRII